MLRIHEDLNRRVDTSLDANVGRVRNLHLVQANSAREGIVAGADDGKGRHDLMRHLERSAIGAIGSHAQVDLQHGGCVADEPAGLEGYRASGRGPVCAVCRQRDSATFEGMLVLGQVIVEAA